MKINDLITKIMNSYYAKLCVFILFIFYLVKFVNNLRKKIKNSPKRKEGFGNNKESNIKNMNAKANINKNKEANIDANADTNNFEIKVDASSPTTLASSASSFDENEELNGNVINNQSKFMQNVNARNTGIARRSENYNDGLDDKLTDVLNKLLVNEYGSNYMEIVEKMDSLFSLRMLESMLTMNLNVETQMLSKVDKLNKYGNAKDLIDKVKSLINIYL